ncbi:MAG TPA: DUF1190 domain-containing protein [Alphaproteobacteria bacterium]|jgi:uncharacterized protein YgiB involved in biofilm formation
MKKSQTIKLALLGGASLALAACGDDGPPQDARFFADDKECSAVYGDAPCKDAEAKADEVHLTQAPKYEQREQCEAEFGVGNCETRQTAGGGSFFMPLLMGYMMGNMLNGGNRFSQPVYRGRDGSAVMNNNGRLFNVGAFGGGSGRATSFRPATQVAQVSRGGFGGSAARFGSGGAGG